MENKSKISVIGHFGGNIEFHDGQTIKTRNLYEALKRQGYADIRRVDTFYIRHNPLKFFADFFLALFSSNKIIVLLSDNGRKVLFPVLSFTARILKKEIYHDSIGGQLADEAEHNCRWKKYISSFRGNWVESSLIAERLNQNGIKNAVYVPNFKRLQRIREEELPGSFREPYQFCTFSRVMKEKGIEDAIAAIEEINREAGRQRVKLDIYGPIEPAFEARFRELLQGAEACTYRGIEAADKSVLVLKNYYALLFPTYWIGEGMPGTVIDALAAGLPVIARRWKYCDDMLCNNETGYLYDFDHPELLKSIILKAIENEQKIIEMKKNCLKKADDFSEENVIQQIISLMQL